MSRTAAKLRRALAGVTAVALVMGMSLALTQLVLAAPPLGFTVTPEVPIAGQSATFTATDTRPGDSVSWDFENDGTIDATGLTVQHVYATAGQRTVRMRATKGDDAKDVLKVVRVDAPPSASFTASPNPATIGQAVQFNAGASTDSDGTIVKYEWDLDGNGSFETVTGSTPTTSKVYTSGGTVTVKLRVTDNDGAIAEHSVAVVVNSRPIARFTASPNPALVGQAVTFDASGSSDPDGTVASYAWDLDDDGQFDDASGVTASRSFSAAGAYSVRLSVTDDRGSTDTATVAVTVSGTSPSNRSPVASFTAAPNPAGTGQAVQFNASASTDPDGTIAGYAWDLDGNGSFETTTGSTPTTSKAYAEPGNVNVRLRVTDDKGATAESTVTVVVQNRPPVASFTAAPNPAMVGQTVQFSASASSDPDGTIAGYAWDLDNDGQFDDASGAGTSHSFATAGIHTVRLRVTDNRGSTDTATVAVTVNNLPPPPVPNQSPVASFTAAPNPAPTGQAVQFNASASSDPDGTIAGYAWDLDGNGSFETTTGSTPTTSKAYAEPGNVNVRLRVTDDDGATAVRTLTVVVENRAPVASFTAAPNPATVDQTVQLNASASSDPDGTIAGYAWDLDNDGQFDDASGAGTSHSFATAGIHTVRLRVTDNRGSTDTATVAVTVTGAPVPPAAPPPNRPPVASFTSSPAAPLAGDTVYFSSTSTDPDGPLASHAWDLDDDGQFDDSSSRAAAMRFANPGLYVVSLRVADAKGTADVESRTIIVGAGLASAQPGLRLMTPFPVVRITGRSTRSGARIKLLMVRGAPRGATVTVRCRGAGCRRRRQSRQVRSGSVRLRAFERTVRAGTRIQVFITQPGRIGKYTSFKIRSRRPPLRRDLCVTSVTAKPKPCPTS